MLLPIFLLLPLLLPSSHSFFFSLSHVIPIQRRPPPSFPSQPPSRSPTSPTAPTAFYGEYLQYRRSLSPNFNYLSAQLSTNIDDANGENDNKDVFVDVTKKARGEDVSKDDDKKEWEWDGIIIEGAHDAEFEPGSGLPTDDEEDAFLPSIGFMSIASSVSSPALSISSSTSASSDGGLTSSTSSVNFDPLSNGGDLHRRFLQNEKDFLSSDEELNEEDLLEMGGDPFFLDNLDDSGERVGAMDNLAGDDSEFFEWDGMVDEDAHLDLD